ncbi:MAG TPA: hypothetical protein VG963_26235, partial [Polyangiaceae bacterium]|nr:hypothetical protein [Polyangiaceae bacterium]
MNPFDVGATPAASEQGKFAAPANGMTGASEMLSAESVPPASFGAFQSAERALNRKALPGPSWAWGALAAVALVGLGYLVMPGSEPAPAKHGAAEAAHEGTAAKAEAAPAANANPSAPAATPAPAPDAPAAAATPEAAAKPEAAKAEAAKPEAEAAKPEAAKP